MFRAQIRVSDQFARITAEVEALARRSTQAAAEQAATVAQAAASIDLELQVLSVRGDSEGFSAGIRSEKKGARSTRIATFFDKGTLGGRKTALKRPGRSNWTVNRSTGPYTAGRRDVTGKGIPAERFFLKARLAGRKAMSAQLKRGL